MITSGGNTVIMLYYDPAEFYPSVMEKQVFFLPE